MSFCWLCSGGFFVGCAPVGFGWLWGLDLWVWPCSMALPLVWPGVMGVTVGLAIGCGCHYRCGHGPWVAIMVLGFFLLGLLVSDGGSVFGYNGGWLCLCRGLPSDL